MSIDHSDDSAETGDDADTAPTEEPRPATEDSIPAEVAAAVLTSDDLEGWEVDFVDVADELALDDCPDRLEVLDNVTNVVKTELRAMSGPGEGLNGIFQDVVIFNDSSAAADYLDLVEGSAADCPQEASGSGDLPISREVPSELPEDLGDRSVGSRLEFEPGAFSEVISSMDQVYFQRGNIVVGMAAFLPLAQDVDLVELASGVDASL